MEDSRSGREEVCRTVVTSCSRDSRPHIYPPRVFGPNDCTQGFRCEKAAGGEQISMGLSTDCNLPIQSGPLFYAQTAARRDLVKIMAHKGANWRPTDCCFYPRRRPLQPILVCPTCLPPPSPTDIEGGRVRRRSHPRPPPKYVSGYACVYGCIYIYIYIWVYEIYTWSSMIPKWKSLDLLR
jgi:hypothetical protein